MVPKFFTNTHTHTHTHARTHAHTHTPRPILCIVFLRKCRNKTKMKKWPILVINGKIWKKIYWCKKILRIANPVNTLNIKVRAITVLFLIFYQVIFFRPFNLTYNEGRVFFNMKVFPTYYCNMKFFSWYHYILSSVMLFFLSCPFFNSFCLFSFICFPLFYLQLPHYLFTNETGTTWRWPSQPKLVVNEGYLNVLRF